MKKLIYLIIAITVLGLIVAGCTNSVVPPTEQSKAAKGAIWQVPGDFATIQEAIDNSGVSDGDTIMVGPGEHAGALVTKAVEIKGKGGAVINSGPLPWPGAALPRGTFMAGFLFPGGDIGSGTTISNLQFETVEFPVFSRGADNVTVDHCTFLNSIQAVTNWHGSGWNITHNVIQDLQTSNGGGIGIFCGCVSGGVSNYNLVSHNKITGTLYVDPEDRGGYNGTGIVLYADFRYYPTYPGADEIAFNSVVKNKISLTSDTPNVVDVVAIELTDTRNIIGDPDPVIFDNAIGFNDLRGTEIQNALTPEDLGDYNDISRNLGDNRGHGLHPAAFGPGGN